jgi:DNA-binding NtrC family response regulator
MRLLIVDDDAMGAHALATLLRMDGFEVVELHSARQALERVRAERFDAILSDLEMPGVHGLDLLRAVRSTAPATPVYVITGYSESAASDKAILAGARRVFGKPLAYDALCDELMGHAERLASS